MSNRPLHLTIIAFRLVAALFIILPSLRTPTLATPLASVLDRIENLIAEILALAARLNPAKLRNAAFATPRPNSPATRPATNVPSIAPRAPRQRDPLSPHAITTRLADLLQQLDAALRTLGALIPAAVRTLCDQARAEAARRLHPIRYVFATKRRAPLRL